jgi:2-C-methyl-D-erythritol 2,4-cyclodiphosphate synthase
VADGLRVGIGYDVHRLVGGRPLILGGVSIEYELGLDGHSDADVLLHAVMDSLLGAAGLDDIGHQFPPDNDRFLNASSLRLLETVRSLIEESGWRIANIDSTVVAERPKLAPHLERMKTAIAEVLRITERQVGIKATTNEGLGYAGRREGIAAMAVALLVRREEQELEG